MNVRERFLATLRDGRAGCAPHFERAIRDEVVAAWAADGLAPDEVQRLMAWDRWQLGGQAGPPSFELRPRPPLERPVADLDDAAAWWSRFTDQPALPESWAAEAEAVRERDWPLGLHVWRGILQTLGIADGHTLVDVLLFLADYPDRVEAMMDRYSDWVARLLERALADVAPDFLVLGEPIASHHAPVISPAMARRFLAPCYRKLIGLGRRHGITLFAYDSYGQVGPLLEMAVEAGCNVLWLGQAGAVGLDYRELRRRFGPGLGLMGGIDARILRAGPEAIDRELRRVALPLLEQGRYLPMLDDRVRTTTSAAGFAAYRAALDRLLAETSS